MSEYKKLTIDEYINILNEKESLTKQLEKEIRYIRSLDVISNEQFLFLTRSGVILRIKDFKSPRSLFCKDDGTIVYWNSVKREFQIVGYFSDSETEDLLSKRELFLKKRKANKKK